MIPTACDPDCLRSGLLLVSARRSQEAAPPCGRCAARGVSDFITWQGELSVGLARPVVGLADVVSRNCHGAMLVTALPPLPRQSSDAVMRLVLWGGFFQDDTFKPLAQNVTPLPSVRQRLSLDTVADVAKTLPTFRSVLHAMNVDVALEPQPQSVDV